MTPNRERCLCAELAASVIALVKENDFVARVKLGHQQSDDRSHATGVDDRIFGMIEGGEFTFDHFFVRVAVAAVFLAVLFFADVFENAIGGFKRIGAAAADRIGDRIIRFLSSFASVNTGGARTGESVIKGRTIGFFVGMEGQGLPRF
jgi:hypothetical protein